MALKRVFVIWEYVAKIDDWAKWYMPKPHWATKKAAEDYLLEYWKDLDIDQVEYKMDDFQIEEDYIYENSDN